jgi:hypothetical protein
MPLGAARFGLGGADLGSLELIQSQAVSGVSAINFTDLQGSKYDLHILEINKLKFTSAGNNLRLRVSNDGGSSYESGSVYSFTDLYYSQVAGSNEYRSTNASFFDIGLLGGFGTNNAMNFYAEIYNANASSQYTYFTCQGVSHSSAVHHGQGMFFGGCTYKAQETINGFSLFGDGGNAISTCTASLYGVKK